MNYIILCISIIPTLCFAAESKAPLSLDKQLLPKLQSVLTAMPQCECSHDLGFVFTYKRAELTAKEPTEHSGRCYFNNEYGLPLLVWQMCKVAQTLKGEVYTALRSLELPLDQESISLRGDYKKTPQQFTNLTLVLTGKIDNTSIELPKIETKK